MHVKQHSQGVGSRLAAVWWVVAVMGLGPWGAAAAANESHCYSIQDADQKNQCLALAKRQESYCYSIRAQDLKNLCLAQTKNQKSYCYSIRSNDTKNQCLALTR